jgi:hypothetical protein
MRRILRARGSPPVRTRPDSRRPTARGRSPPRAPRNRRRRGDGRRSGGRCLLSRSGARRSAISGSMAVSVAGAGVTFAASCSFLAALVGKNRKVCIDVVDPGDGTTEARGSPVILSTQRARRSHEDHEIVPPTCFSTARARALCASIEFLVFNSPQQSRLRSRPTRCRRHGRGRARRGIPPGTLS